MSIVAKKLTEEDINSKGKKSLAKAKKVILIHSEMCNQRLEMSYQLSQKVYTLVVIKVRNSRFGEVLANYSKKNQLKIKESLESKQNS